MLLCPKQPWVLVCRNDNSVRVPLHCGCYRCDTCGAAKVHERVRLMVWAASKCPIVRMITLTRVPSSWQQARWQVRDLVRRLRKAYTIEMAWAIERNPKGTGFHLHAISHGEHIPKKRLKEMWGGRHIDVRAVDGHAEGYLTKCASVAGYLTKDRQQHLDLNGGRAVHFTRGFLHGWTSRQALQEMSGGNYWRLERPDVSRGEFVDELATLPAAA